MADIGISSGTHVTASIAHTGRSSATICRHDMNAILTISFTAPKLYVSFFSKAQRSEVMLTTAARFDTAA